ncbi:MAG: hypothetical protein ABL958_18465, partial [Bdellovibrionia bacterium]
MRILRHGLALSFAFLFATGAGAEIKNQNLLPMGEKEAFRGNAGTAAPGSAGAVYYNPAGLAVLKGARISVSGTTFMYFDAQTDKLLHWDNSDFAYEEYGFASIPASLVATWGEETWVYAFSILTTGNTTFKNWASWDTTNARTYFTRFADANETWVGLSGARAVSEFWSFGATLFVVRSASSSLANFTSRATTTTIFKLLTITTMAQSNVFTGVGTLGALYRA